MALIILVRHGESDGNATQIITGHRDVPLTQMGREQARQAAMTLKRRHIAIHRAHVSQLKRAQETLTEMQQHLDSTVLPVEAHSALNERDFGALTGRLKLELQRELGDDAYKAIVKGWNKQAPGGESLKMVYDRVVPLFQASVYPEVMHGSNVLIVSHHQTLRALVKYLEDISDDEIVDVKIENGGVLVYQADAKGSIRPY